MKSAEQQIRSKFKNDLMHTDLNGKKFLLESELFSGPHKLTVNEFNTIITLSPPITVHYIVSSPKKSLVNKIFSYKLPIQHTLAFWCGLSAGMLYYSPKDAVILPVLVGFFSWFLIEQAYHRAGHLSVSNETQMRFIYELHWKHHFEPDRPGSTVSPIVKNLLITVAIFFMFEALRIPNSPLAIAVLSVQFTFYEAMHWLSHTKKANQVAKIPVIGKFLSNIVAHHRAHHILGDRYAVSTGTLCKNTMEYIGIR